MEENSKMLKKKIWIAPPVFTLFLLLAPTSSHASPLIASLISPQAGLIAKLAHWLDFLPGAARAKKPRVPARHATSVQEKHGCGIDPQGQPYCEP